MRHQLSATPEELPMLNETKELPQLREHRQIAIN
jgi:hypothetical protein